MGTTPTSAAHKEAEQMPEASQHLLVHSYWARPESIHPDPSEALPVHTIPAGVAKQIVNDILELDMNPRLNMAGWLTTFMEEEGKEIITKALYINAPDAVQYPSASIMAQRCIKMVGNLWHAPEGFIGTETIGSTEAIYLGVLAAKKNWQAKRREAGLSCDRPNMVYGANAQVAWHKSCSYFDIESRQVKLHDGQLVMDPEKVPDLVDENTILVAAMVGSTYTGQYEDVSRLNEVLEEVRADRGLDIPIHVDAAAGGLIAPLCQPHFKFDFLNSRVRSISFSGHKYGMVFPGIAFIVFHSDEWVPSDMKFVVDYLGKREMHMTLNFSRPGAYVAGQYYNFVRLGKEGYRCIFANLFKVYDFLAEELEKTGHFEVLSKGDLPVVAFRLKPDLNKPYDEFDIMHRLKEHRLMLPAYRMAADAQHIKLLRACIRPGFDLEMAQWLVDSLHGVIKYLDEHGAPQGKPAGEQGEQQGQHALC